MIFKFKAALCCAAITALALSSSRAQEKAEAKKTDSVKTSAKAKANPLKKIKPYKEVINKNYNSQKGLFTVHRYRDTTYFELGNNILNRDILVVNRLAAIPDATSIFPGEVLDENMIRFELGADSSIKMKLLQRSVMANPNSNIAMAVNKSYTASVIASFPIKAYANDSASYVVDLTKYLAEPGVFNSFAIGNKLGDFVNGTTIKDFEVLNTRPFEENVEFTFRKSMTRKRPTSTSTQATIETYTSMLLLPQVPMRKRLEDARVGYFSTNYTYFDDHQHSDEKLAFISRWRLEPKDADLARWKKGEMVEPKKQIVIYIDPATPKQWVPYLIKGVNDWQKAFEHAGFKNAIIAKEWPVNDPNMHWGDARYSIIQYYPSSTPNARGPHVADPRSGEIIHTRIDWYHNVMDILDRWFKIQTAAVAPGARKPKLDDNLMGELIRTVSSHEVGHTLGLRHNHGSSSFTPVEKLRDAKYLKEHGHTVSIMDYARFNYVAQPEDKIPVEDLFPKIGAYDKWAIKWGYGYAGGKDEFEDRKILGRILSKKLAESPNVVYLDGEMLQGDFRVQTEDLGDDSMKASAYGIKNLQLILSNLLKWFGEDGKNYNTLAKYHQELLSQYQRYVQHVVKNIGSFSRDPKVIGDEGVTYKPASRERQIAAVNFLDEYLFKTQNWLINPKLEDLYHDLTYEPKQNPTHRHPLGNLQHITLNTILHDGMLHKIWSNSNRYANSYTVEEHLKMVHDIVWRELKSPKVEMNHLRRNLQKTYVGNLADILKYKNVQTAETDVPTLVKYELKSLKAEIASAITKADGINKLHLEDIAERLEKALEPKS